MITGSGGEHPNARKAIDDLIRRQVNDGVPAKEAEKRAKETAKRHDRQTEK